jgi:hypothetical protein
VSVEVTWNKGVDKGDQETELTATSRSDNADEGRTAKQDEKVSRARRMAS